MSNKEPIRGWLIIIGVFTWIAPIAYLLDLVIDVTTHQLSTVVLIEGIIPTIFSIALLILFLQRRKAFVTWEYIYLTYGVVVEAITDIAVHDVTHGMNVAIAFIEAILIGGYLLRSNRVKRTFVR